MQINKKKEDDKMLVKAIFRNKDFDYFNDKLTGVQRKYGDIFECDDDIAQERIKNKFVKKATKDEEKEYYANQTTVDDDIPVSTEQEEQQIIDDINNNCTDELDQ